MNTGGLYVIIFFCMFCLWGLGLVIAEKLEKRKERSEFKSKTLPTPKKRKKREFKWEYSEKAKERRLKNHLKYVRAKEFKSPYKRFNQIKALNELNNICGGCGDIIEQVDKYCMGCGIYLM